jgi:uncharacterized membrane protein
MSEPWHPININASMQQSDIDTKATLSWYGQVNIPDDQHFHERRTDENQAILPGMMLLAEQMAQGQAPAGNVPLVQGTPQAGGVPAVQGTPAMPVHPAGAQALYHNAPASAPNAPSAPSWVPHTSPPEAPPAHRRRHQTSGQLHTHHHTHHHKPRRRHVPRPHGPVQHLLVAAVAVVVIATSAAIGALTIFRPALSLSVNGGITSGGTFQLHGQNFTPGSSVTLTLDHGVPLSADGHGDGGTANYGSGFANVLQMSVAVERSQQGTTQSTSIPVSIQGSFDVTIHVGQNWTEGVHTIHATDRILGRSADLQFTIPPSQAKLVVTPSSVLDFGSLETGRKVALSVIIGNTGGRQLHWSADVGSTPWLKVQPASGMLLPGNHEQVVNIIAYASNLAAKDYSAVLHIGSDAGDARIAVKLKVVPPGTVSSAKAILDVNPASLDFGTQTVGVQVTQNVTLANTGTQALSWGADTGNASWLKLSSNSGKILPGGLPQVLSVTADTTQLAAGNHSATLNITSNGGNKQVVITVVVTSPPPTPAALTVNPSSLDFGTLNPGTSKTLQETVNNTGGQALTWNLDTTSLPGWLSVDTSSGTVSAGGQQTINVKADTSNLSPGPYTTTLNFASNGGNKSVQVSLVVNTPKQSPQMTVSPNSLDFGALDPNATKTMQETISNTGGQTLNWMLDTTSLPSWLTVDKLSDTIQAGNQETINVKANTANLSPGSYPFTLNFTSNGGSASLSVTLAVNASSPPPAQIAVSPNPLDFGKMDPGTTQTLQVTVKNTGGQPLNWNVNTGGTNWLSVDKSSDTVQPGSSEMINVTANTTDLSPGSYPAALNFTSNGGNASVTVTLTVNAPPPPPAQIAVSPNPLDFGALDPNATKTLPETIGNSGGQPLTWNLDTTSLPGWLSVDTNTGTVQANSSQTINVTANTANLQVGPYKTTLNFTSNGGSASLSVTLTVNAPPPPPGQIAVSANSLDFGSVTSGNTATLPETISNTGGQALTWKLDPTSLPGWLTVDKGSDTVQPGSQETINVKANTANLKVGGPYTATLSFTSNGGNVQVTVTMTVVPPIG